ncbi:MAG: 1-acyl-sn-glycerol-3-phosphate acyltransferase [Leptospiraceae bacterium]|nr:1-acyl-sn-glycerol-3-phosphate acyltransferase [Leptospiraceae bacterium]MCB1199069.1 1-acyl-sn-glycerol-3-phosphate acyltransferase [Leptospiraceae bacterium]
MATLKFYITMALSGLYTALLSVVFMPFSVIFWSSTITSWVYARCLSFGTLKILGIKLEVTGREHLAACPAVLMVNHQSNMDAYLFGTVFPKRTVVIAKKELLKVPFFGIMLLATGNIMIDRDARKAAKQAVEKGTSALKKSKYNLWVFPEGTRSRGSGLANFRKGGFHIAASAGSPIIPIVGQPVETVIDLKKKRVYGGLFRISILPALPAPENSAAAIQKSLGSVEEAVTREWDRLSRLAGFQPTQTGISQ